MKISHLSTITLLTLKRIWNRKFAVYIILISPIVLCVTFGYVAHKSPERISTFVVLDGFQQASENGQIWRIIDEIGEYQTKDGSKPFSVTDRNSSMGQGMQLLDKGETRAVILMGTSDSGIVNAKVIVDATEPSVSSEFEQELPLVFDNYSKGVSTNLIIEFLTQQKHSPPEVATQAAKQIMAPFEITYSTDAWKELIFFDFFASAAIVLIALGLPLLLSAISVTNERSMGTLERVFATPYRKSEIIIGKMLANNIIAMVITILILITLKVVFDITLGNIGLILLLAFLVAVNGVIFGLLVSSVTYSEKESLLLAILFILLFLLQMTYLWPWETMHPVARFISYMIPYTYGFQAIRHVNMVGAGLADVWMEILALVGFIIAQALIAIQVLRREIE